MAHAVELMVSYNGITPWHGLGLVANDNTSDTTRALRDGGIDWSVVKVPLCMFDGTEIETHCAVQRTSDGKCLGVVSKRYELLQNADMFAAFEPLLQAGHATWETAGALWGGAVVFGQIKFAMEAEIVPGDLVQIYGLVSNSHDGSRRFRLTLTSTRVVCNNTLRIGEASGDCLVSARHTSGIHNAVAQATELMVEIERKVQAAIESYRRLAARRMTDVEITEYLCSLIPAPKAAEGQELSAGQKAAQTRAQGVRDEITRLLSHGTGVEIDGVMGSAWGVLNAVTEYADHVRDADASEEDRQRAQWFGATGELKDRAYETILAYL